MRRRGGKKTKEKGGWGGGKRRDVGQGRMWSPIPVEVVFHEHERAIDKVSKIVQQFRIYPCNKIIPVESSVLN